ncbi:MAG: rhomboid family intramembrane serine protease, partial [Alphaproteobacteria bacterium]|nr:rhomboid family intramembrane serine protease [Alphaproteobacteria bacterium]
TSPRNRFDGTTMFFLPLYDINPTLRRPWLTYAIIALCLAWYLGVQVNAPPFHVYEIGFIPARFFHGVELPAELNAVSPTMSIFTSMISHGGFMHLFSNCFVLYLLADNVEDAIGGKLKFLAFAILTGIAGTLGHALLDTTSTVPLVGISGVCSGMIGAYILLHPRAQFRCLVVVLVFFRTMNIPAFAIFAFWLIGQITGVFSSGDNVAYWAHLSGLAAGMALIPIFKRKSVPLMPKENFPTGVATIRKVWRR